MRLKLRRHTVVTPDLPPPSDEWMQGWYGYSILQESIAWNDKPRYNARTKHFQTAEEDSILQPGELEDQCILNVVAHASESEFTAIELGAGRGDACLKVAASVNFGLVSTVAKEARCLAVEAHKVHCEWIRRHFGEQGINGRAVYGGAWHEDGHAYFRPRGNPAANYGSGVHRGRGVRVRTFTLGRLMDRFGFPRVNLVHMDVQSAEARVIRGAPGVISKRLVDYFLIELHKEKYAKKIVQMTRDHYNIVLRTPVKKKEVFESPLGPTLMPKCGLLLLERKGIESEA